MLNIEEIHEEIKKLEECKCTTQDVCKKLAILYIVKDHYCSGGGCEEKSGNGTSTKNINTGMMSSITVPTMSSPTMMEK